MVLYLIQLLDACIKILRSTTTTPRPPCNPPTPLPSKQHHSIPASMLFCQLLSLTSANSNYTMDSGPCISRDAGWRSLAGGNDRRSMKALYQNGPVFGGQPTGSLLFCYASFHIPSTWNSSIFPGSYLCSLPEYMLTCSES